jgi:hypothetical protein
MEPNGGLEEGVTLAALARLKGLDIGIAEHLYRPHDAKVNGVTGANPSGKLP